MKIVSDPSALKSIQVASTVQNVNFDRCFTEGQYFLSHFAECLGLLPTSQEGGTGDVGIQWDLNDIVNWFFGYISAIFLEPTWNGLRGGSESGISHILVNVIPSTLNGVFNAGISAFQPLIDIGGYIGRGGTTGTLNGIQSVIGPITNTISSGMKSGIFDFFTLISNSWEGQQNNVGSIVRTVINQLGNLPSLFENIGQLVTNAIPSSLTDVAERIQAILKADYRNTPSCTALKYILFDNPVSPYVYGLFPELGPAALTAFKAACYTTYTEGFFENFDYPIATWGIPWAQPTTALPTIKAVDLPSPQQVVDFLKSVTLQKVLDGITNMKIFQNALSFWENTVPISSGRSVEPLDPKSEQLARDLEGTVIQVARRTRKQFRHCSGTDCCTLEEILTGHCM